MLLIFGILAAVSGVALKGDAQTALLIAGAVLIIMYFATLSAVLAVCSTGGERITVPVLQRLERAAAAVTVDFVARVANSYRVDLGFLFKEAGPWAKNRARDVHHLRMRSGSVDGEGPGVRVLVYGYASRTGREYETIRVVT